MGDAWRGSASIISGRNRRAGRRSTHSRNGVRGEEAGRRLVPDGVEQGPFERAFGENRIRGRREQNPAFLWTGDHGDIWSGAIRLAFGRAEESRRSGWSGGNHNRKLRQWRGIQFASRL